MKANKNYAVFVGLKEGDPVYCYKSWVTLNMANKALKKKKEDLKDIDMVAWIEELETSVIDRMLS